MIFIPRAKQLIEQKRMEKEDNENQVELKIIAFIIYFVLNSYLITFKFRLQYTITCNGRALKNSLSLL